MTSEAPAPQTPSPAPRRPPPESTYRVQFHAGFTFRDATAIVPYLHDLGVTHLYASPFLKARQGSTHGYDVVAHGAVNPEVGSLDDFDALAAALHGRGMGLVCDIVPNHMGVAANENLWWNDVLENGPAAAHADAFDIAWKGARPELQDKVLLPVLGEPYGEALETGKLRLAYDGGAFFIHYYDRRLPVAPRSYALVLGGDLADLAQSVGAESPEFAEYQSILTAIGHLPDRTELDPARVAERRREKEVVKRRLAGLVDAIEPVRRFLATAVERFNGMVGDPRSFDRLDDLLSHQCYRLSYWRVALEEINYRRFFDVNELAALSVERADVFEAVHTLVFRWMAEGKVDGLRVDHPDGLYDPRQYFERLQEAFATAVGLPAPAPGDRPLYVVAEKILGAREALPAAWPVHGTSGYEFANAVNGLFVDPAAERPLTRFYRELVEDYARFPEVQYRCKRLILGASLASELNMLALQLDRLAQKGRRSRDFTLNGLRGALREVIACFPVYRSYVAGGVVGPADREAIEVAVRRAAARNPLMGEALFRFLRDLLLLAPPAGAPPADRAEQERFVGKFQQVTSPVMAKGVEDTAFYIYNRLISLNEVGGDPGRFGLAPEAVHRFLQDRQASWPRALSPLSTHDTKRSEDVRARVNALTEFPDEWEAAVRRWFALNAGRRTEVDGAPAPGPNEEYLLYQTLIGSWPPGADAPGPDYVGRVQAFMVKALHEAKVHSSWVNPNAAYDEAVRAFVARALAPGSDFLADFLPVQRRAARTGAVNSLAQTLLRLTAPGVADTYQGTESTDFSLVDPDNRRPVDYDHRRRALQGLREGAGRGPGFARELLGTIEDGRAKLYLTWRALHARRSHPGLFAEGDYLPVEATGPAAGRLFAFARRLGPAAALVVVPRLIDRAPVLPGEGPPGAAWEGTHLTLPEAVRDVRWTNELTGEAVEPVGGALAASTLLANLPVALLVHRRD